MCRQEAVAWRELYHSADTCIVGLVANSDFSGAPGVAVGCTGEVACREVARDHSTHGCHSMQSLSGVVLGMCGCPID